MAKTLLTCLLLGLAFFGLSSCSDLREGSSVLLGNYNFQRGEYQKAALEYLEILKGSRYPAWIQYNLGNVYKALGESNTALAVWNSVDQQATPELLFRLHFNKGHLLFQKGLYQEAYESFKKALLLQPSSLDTKRNLELSLIKSQAFGSGAVVKPPVTPESLKAGQEAQAMLDYIQRLEGNQWKSTQTPPAADSSQDW